MKSNLAATIIICTLLVCVTVSGCTGHEEFACSIVVGAIILFWFYLSIRE